MNTTGMTTMEIKKINKSKVYHLIYESRTISKQGIAAALQMGMNTVTQNLKLLEEEGSSNGKDTLNPQAEERPMRSVSFRTPKSHWALKCSERPCTWLP